MQIKPAQVKELRERTGAGMMDCKKALVEAGGDIDAASDLLRMAGQAKADRKASRIAAEGQVLVASDPDGGRYALLEVNSETDFVAKDENFRAFTAQVGQAVLEHAPASVEALMELESGGAAVSDMRQGLISKIGENIVVRRFSRLESTDTVGSYVHMDRIGVLVELAGGSVELARDLAMHVAAAAPLHVSIEDVPQDEVARETEILSAQAAQTGKPEQIVQKIVAGRLRKHFDEVTLTGQQFVKDTDTKVGQLLAKNGARVKRFVRFEVGEGIEKKQTGFGEEVAALL